MNIARKFVFTLLLAATVAVPMGCGKKEPIPVDGPPVKLDKQKIDKATEAFKEKAAEAKQAAEEAGNELNKAAETPAP